MRPNGNWKFTSFLKWRHPRHRNPHYLGVGVGVGGSTGVGVGVGVGLGVSVGACVRECVCARLRREDLGDAQVLLSNIVKTSFREGLGRGRH